jgi:hypothetical protein
MPNLARTYSRTMFGQRFIATHGQDFFFQKPALHYAFNACARNPPDRLLSLCLSFSFLLIFRNGLMPVMPNTFSVWSGLQR